MPAEPPTSSLELSSYNMYLLLAPPIILLCALAWFFISRKQKGKYANQRSKAKTPAGPENRRLDTLTITKGHCPAPFDSVDTEVIPGWFPEFPQQIIERLEAIEQAHRRTLDLMKHMLDFVRQNEAGRVYSNVSVQGPQREEFRPRATANEAPRPEPVPIRTGTKQKEEELLGERFLACCQESNFFFKKAWERFISTLPWQPQVVSCWYDRMTTGSGLQPGEAGDDTNKVDCRLLYAQSDQRICYLFSGFLGTVNPKPEDFLYCELQGSAQDRVPDRITVFVPPVIVDHQVKQKGLIIYGS